MLPDLDALRLAALRTIPDRPSAETLFDIEGGTIAIGRHLDGSRAALEVFGPDGVVCATVTGLPGYGLDALLDTLWAAEAATGLVESWVIDLGDSLGSGRTSSRPLERRAGTVAEADSLVTAARELVLTRVHGGLARTRYEDYRPTADQKLVTLTAVGLADLPAETGHLQRELETIVRWAAFGGLHLRAVDRPGRRVPGALGRSLANGARIELLADGPGADGERAPAGTGLLTAPYAEQAELFRVWSPPAP
ncbi:hypothetical protein CFP65_6889 [Kitasatospora sp. MMS16-BH015]|uniref:hypothetical protein n=1 Tax=Kitasatospora sp. MMS16-BH015 TaxID=2018025 RepID=UPI000CA3CD38|nr:hypothetical protein [Kitasatospora sp. MMS16-BH015]AUG81513.1 hypothetical protein CFP65_6889 [Kitasatospora sp. MMS16-BH015]